jgi:hypothetical protein
MAETEIEAAVHWLWWINAAKTAGVFLVAIGVAAESLANSHRGHWNERWRWLGRIVSSG